MKNNKLFAWLHIIGSFCTTILIMHVVYEWIIAKQNIFWLVISCLFLLAAVCSFIYYLIKFLPVICRKEISRPPYSADPVPNKKYHLKPGNWKLLLPAGLSIVLAAIFIVSYKNSLFKITDKAYENILSVISMPAIAGIFFFLMKWYEVYDINRKLKKWLPYSTRYFSLISYMAKEGKEFYVIQAVRENEEEEYQGLVRDAKNMLCMMKMKI